MCGGCPRCGFPDAAPTEAELEDLAQAILDDEEPSEMTDGCLFRNR
jgi:hypothetical protein